MISSILSLYWEWRYNRRLVANRRAEDGYMAGYHRGSKDRAEFDEVSYSYDRENPSAYDMGYIDAMYGRNAMPQTAWND